MVVYCATFKYHQMHCFSYVIIKTNSGVSISNFVKPISEYTAQNVLQFISLLNYLIPDIGCILEGKKKHFQQRYENSK